MDLFAPPECVCVYSREASLGQTGTSGLSEGVGGEGLDRGAPEKDFQGFGEREQAGRIKGCLEVLFLETVCSSGLK